MKAETSRKLPAAGMDSAGEGRPRCRWTAMFGRFDRLDWLSLAAIVVLGLAVAVLVVTYPADAPTRKELRRSQLLDPQLAAALDTAANLIAAGNLRQADELVGQLERDYPYNGKVHMLRADLHLLRQQPIQAMLAMRKAVDLYPDLLDRKSDDFQGRKIKNTMQEAWELLNDESAGLDGEERQRYRKVFYYMQRKLAGSCG